MQKNYFWFSLIILFITTFTGIILSEAYADKHFFHIKDHNILFFNLDYWDRINNLIKNGFLQFSLQENNDLTLSQIDNKIYLHLNTPNSQETWKLYINNTSPKSPLNKNIIVNYKVNYTTPKKDLDLTDEIIKKSIQKMPLSCEISAAADIITYLTWKNIPEDELLKILPKDNFNTTAQRKNNLIFWWNPNKWFVWYIDYYNGKKPTQRGMTWYWVYEQPIANIFQKYNLNTKTYNKYDFKNGFWSNELLSHILHEFYEGKMVQLWWDRCTDPNYEDGTLEKWMLSIHTINPSQSEKNHCLTFEQDRRMFWYYKDEEWNLVKHQGFRWEHVFYLLGYKGTPETPTHIIVWDTNTGRHVYPIEEWMRKWKALDYRTIIIENKI